MSKRSSSSTRLGQDSVLREVPCKYCGNEYSKRGIGEHERRCHSRWSLTRWSFWDLFEGILWVFGSLKTLIQLGLLALAFAYPLVLGGFFYWLASKGADVVPNVFASLVGWLRLMQEKMLADGAE